MMLCSEEVKLLTYLILSLSYFDFINKKIKRTFSRYFRQTTEKREKTLKTLKASNSLKVKQQLLFSSKLLLFRNNRFFLFILFCLSVFQIKFFFFFFFLKIYCSFINAYITSLQKEHTK
jgi:hypothetical protein